MSENKMIISDLDNELDIILDKISDKNLHKSLLYQVPELILDDNASKGNETW